MRTWRPLGERLKIDWWRGEPADVAVVHRFLEPPYGGGNQCLWAVRRQWERWGYRVAVNQVHRETPACLVNAITGSESLVRRAPKGCRIVHRVDGPVGGYRGEPLTVDKALAEWNAASADATILQSRYSAEAFREEGIAWVNPVIIPNAVDPTIFYRPRARPPLEGRKVRVMSSSWSDNPNKGLAVYQWLDQHLDWSRYDYTFVGRVQAEFTHIRLMDPVPSRQMAALLREHDIYLTASLHDPCSNALLEALACGLPAVYRKSGGHPELVGTAGEGFHDPEEIPMCLRRIAAEYGRYQRQIQVRPLTDIASAYLSVLGVA